ncbi:MAG TPA: dienelactone hydrolase family protein [Candidatus Binatia bacterium]|nr:dienelactone hydrolase family protein [Candidatus Binatia bacterium]
MRTTRFALFAFFFCAPLLLAQDWAKQALEKSSRHQEWVTLKHDGRSLQAFVVYPEVNHKAAAVVVIHEIFGLSDWARDLADQVAAAGYIAIAPDLLSGFGPKGGGTSDFASTQDAVKAISKLDPAVVTADLDAAADFVKKLPAANGKVAVTGFCWGGGQSFRFATHRQDLRAAFVFYGPPPDSFDTITAPVYGFYAGNDERIGATIPATVEAMKKAGKKYEPVTYEGAGHGFMRSGEDPAGTEPNKKAREEAWKRWSALLKSM